MKSLVHLAVIFPFLLLLLARCEWFDSTEPKPLPPGYQHDIPWPSLADSPWPIYRADPQNTGRCNFGGPQNGILTYTFDSLYTETGITFGADSTIYFISARDSAGLYAFTFDYQFKWKIPISFATSEPSTPLVGADGTIYFADSDKLYAVDPSGTIKWIQSSNSLGGLAFNIGRDGTIYTGGNSRSLFAINPDGSLKWEITDDRFFPFVITLSPDGKTLYIPGTGQNNSGLVAIDIDFHQVKWIFGTVMNFASPVVDVQGNIYVFTSIDDPPVAPQSIGLYSLNPEGEIRWMFFPNKTWNNYGYQSPTIDKNGNIYFGVDTLFSLDYEGKLRWKRDIPDFITSSLVCDNQDIIYFTIGSIKSVIAIGKNGNTRWELPVNRYSREDISPSLAFNHLFIPSFRRDYILVIN